MNDNENPFAYGAENTHTGGGRGFQDYENPFAFQTEPTAPAAGKGNLDTTYVTYSSNPLRLQRWSAALRLLTFVFCLLAILFTLFSTEKKHPDGIGVNISYKYAGAFKFFFWTNVIVALYALALSITAFVMFRHRTGETTPAFLLWPFIVLDGGGCAIVNHGGRELFKKSLKIYFYTIPLDRVVVNLRNLALCFIILAFASALSIESLNHNGMNLPSTDGDLTISWPPLCSTFKQFCGMIDSALGLSMAGFITLLASTCIDGYILHRKNA